MRRLHFILFIVLTSVKIHFVSAQCPSPGSYSTPDLIFGDSPTNESCTVAGSLSTPSNKHPALSVINSGKFVVGGGNVATNNRTTVGDLLFGGNSTVTINTTDSLIIWGDFTMEGNGDINMTGGVLYVYGNMTITDNAAFGADGTVIIKGNLTVSGSNANVTVDGGFSVGGVAALGGNDLDISTGAVFSATDLTTSGNLTIDNGGTIYVEQGISDGVTGTITNSNTGGDTDCTNNCCGIYCNPTTDQLTPEGEAILPIKLSSFSLSQESNSITLTWTTVSEDNFSHFEIQKWDVSDFVTIANVNSTGYSSGDDYYFTDKSPVLGNNIYRLKSIDFDGYEEIFNAKSILFRPEYVEFKLYPNPGLPAELCTDIYESFQLEVYNLAGHKLMTTTVSNKDLSKLGMLKSGQYIFRYTINGHVVNQHMIIR